MSDLPDLPDLPDPDELKDRLSRRVAVLTVTATLGAAVMGYLVATASRHDDRQDVIAQRHAVRANGGFLRAQHRAQADHQAFVIAEEQRRRASTASLEGFFVGGEEARRLELEEARWTRLAERTDELTTIRESGPDGPERDPTFPTRFFARSSREPQRLAALQDAANQESSVWEAKVAQYTAVLTLFAVALYLFGLSFTMQPRSRRLFARVGTGMLVVGTVWSLLGVVTPPTPAPEEAADAFADGNVAYRTASSPDEYRRAHAHLTRAISLRPDFARAYVLRADATFQAGSPQGSGYASLTRPEALRDAIADLRQARELGADSLTVNASLGFYTFVQGLEDEDEGLLEESQAFTREAIEVDPRDPVGHFNLGVAQLAAGDAEAARASYAEGVRHLLYTDVAKRRLRGNPSLEEQWVAGALTDLELVLRAGRRDLRREVARMKEYVVASASLGRPGVGRGGARATTVAVDVFPAELQWRATFEESFDPERDFVSVQWYRHEPAVNAWAVLPEVSGVRTPGFDEDAANHFDLASYVASTFPPRCLPPGRYRVEIYVNGKLAGSSEGEGTFEDLQISVDRDVGVGFCRPASWVRSEVALPGLLTGQVEPGDAAGVYAFSLPLPRVYDALPVEARAERFLDFVVESFADLFPVKPRLTEHKPGVFFMGLEGSSHKWYEYDGGGRVVAGAGLDERGTVVVGVVFGPAEQVEDGVGLQVFDSLVRIE